MGNQPHVSAADEDVKHVAGEYYTGLWNHHDLGACEVWLANATESVVNRLLAIPRVYGIHNDAPRSPKEIEEIRERLDMAARKDPAISYLGSSPTHDGYLRVLVERDAAYAQAKLDAWSGSDVVRVRVEPAQWRVRIFALNEVRRCSMGAPTSRTPKALAALQSSADSQRPHEARLSVPWLLRAGFPINPGVALPRAKATIKPILEVLSDGKVHFDDEIQESVAKKLRLTPEDRKPQMKNGTPFYKNRTAWGLVYIQDTAYLPDTRPWGEELSRGTGKERYKITSAGLKALRDGLADGLGIDD